ncbi:MAG: ABC transporter substrate-binding protein [Pseudomonadota bacterium]
MIISGVFLSCLWFTYPLYSQNKKEGLPQSPLDMEGLKKALSYARGPSKPEESWPRSIKYQFEIYNFKTDTFSREEQTYEIKKKPCRIIPHAVGVTEILWAICPRERIVAYNEFAADPEFCFLADPIKEKGPIFKSKQTELVIGYQPDLVFTVFYSGADFKEKLKQAKIPYFDLGYFGTIESIKNQTLLIGKIIGEEGNAEALVKIMDDKVRELKARLPRTNKPIRVLYYDEGGYIPGKSSNFNSICEIIEVTNVGAEQGIKSWSQVDYETLLKWDPDIIIVPQEGNLKEQLMESEMLSHASAIKKGKVYYIPGVYLTVDSQYLILSANRLAGIVYGGAVRNDISTKVGLQD